MQYLSNFQHPLQLRLMEKPLKKYHTILASLDQATQPFDEYSNSEVDGSISDDRISNLMNHQPSNIRKFSNPILNSKNCDKRTITTGEL